MRILVLGSGAKDSAAAWYISKSSLLSGLFMARGNYLSQDYAVRLSSLDPSDKESVYRACLEHKIDLVFVGTEAPLLSGIIEYLNERGIDTFGCPSRAIKLEDDKAFARNFSDRHNIPTTKRSLFADSAMLARYLERHKGKHYIIKSNSISPSREILHSDDTEKLIQYAKHLLLRGPVLLEEFVPGLPVTCTVMLDNSGYVCLPFASEYTSRLSSDNTPTGGMGAICPVPLSDEEIMAIKERIIEPTLYALKSERMRYRGVLTFSIIIKEDKEPVLVDYHVRFNDPALQAMVPLLETDALKILVAMKEDRLSELEIKTNTLIAVAVVYASSGYPENPEKGRKITGLTHFKRMGLGGSLLFAGAVAQDEDGNPVTSGGRCITVVGLADTVKEANERAYRTIGSLKIDGGFYRQDIGNRFFEED